MELGDWVTMVKERGLSTTLYYHCCAVHFYFFFLSDSCIGARCFWGEGWLAWQSTQSQVSCINMPQDDSTMVSTWVGASRRLGPLSIIILIVNQRSYFIFNLFFIFLFLTNHTPVSLVSWAITRPIMVLLIHILYPLIKFNELAGYVPVIPPPFKWLSLL